MPLPRDMQSVLGRSGNVSTDGILTTAERGRRNGSPPRRRGRSKSTRTYVPFTHAGPLVVDEFRSPAYLPAVDEKVKLARCWLTDAGSSTTSVAVYRGGTLVETISWAGGANLAIVRFDLVLTGDADRLTVMTTAAGDGASGASIRFEMVPL